MIKKIVFFCCLLSFAITCQAMAALPKEIGFIAYVKGSVHYYSPLVRKWELIQLDKKTIFPVLEGSYLYTQYNSVAIIILEGGTTLRLSANTQLELRKEPSIPVKFRLKAGQLWLKIPHRLNSWLTIETPNTNVYSNLGAVEVNLLAGNPSTEVKIWAGSAFVGGEGQRSVKLCQYQQTAVALRQNPSAPADFDRQKKEDWSKWNVSLDDLYYEKFFASGKVKRETGFLGEFIVVVPAPPTLGTAPVPETHPTKGTTPSTNPTAPTNPSPNLPKIPPLPGRGNQPPTYMPPPYI